MPYSPAPVASYVKAIRRRWSAYLSWVVTFIGEANRPLAAELFGSWRYAAAGLRGKQVWRKSQKVSRPAPQFGRVLVARKQDDAARGALLHDHRSSIDSIQPPEHHVENSDVRKKRGRHRYRFFT